MKGNMGGRLDGEQKIGFFYRMRRWLRRGMGKWRGIVYNIV
jgi:hypothetical protein